MITHGDDIYNYKDIRLNFSSNVYNGFDHAGLFAHLAGRMSCVMNYPEPTPFTLERAIAEHLGICAEDVMVTNGATEAIYLIAQAYRGCRSCILGPTFSEYEEACRLHQHTIVDSTNPAERRGALIWFCNPNNPTGDVQNNIIGYDGIYVADQSYDRFTAKPILSAREAVRKPNVFVLHSMTKEYAIPGMRLGYVVSNKKLINILRRQRMPWSVNSLAIEAGHYLLAHDDEYRIDLDTLLPEAQRVGEALSAMGFDVHHTDTHILLCRIPDEGIVISGTTVYTASQLKDFLANSHGILIRDASNFTGLTPQHFRIAVQTAVQDNVLLQALC